MNKAKLFVAMAVAGLLIAAPLMSVSAQSSPTPTLNTRGTVRANLQERVREMAEKLFDNQFLNRLNAIRARISSNAKLTAEQKSVLLAKIDAEIVWFTSKKGELAGVTTAAQMRAIVREARTRFAKIAKELRHLYLAKGYVTSLEQVITNIEKNIVPKVEAKLAELKESGVNVDTELATLLKVKTALATAKSEVGLVKVSTTYEDAKKHFDAAKVQIKEARTLLKEILESMKTKIED